MTNPVREALKELVRLKDLKDELAAWHPAVLQDAYNVKVAEYNRCQPLAWSAARSALASDEGDGRYSAPLQMAIGRIEQVLIRFAPHDQIHDTPTEANPSPIRVFLVGDVERALWPSELPAHPHKENPDG